MDRFTDPTSGACPLHGTGCGCQKDDDSDVIPFSRHKMFRGDTFTLQAIVKQPPPNSPPGTPPSPIPITGWTVWFTVKNTIPDQDTAAVFRAESPSAQIVFGSQIGQVTVQMPASATAPLTDGKTYLYYDIQVEDLATPPNVSTVDRGIITVYADVTRATS